MRRILCIFSAIFLAIGFAIFPRTLFAATVLDLTDRYTNSQVSAASNHRISFVIPDPLVEGSSFLLVFPSGFNLSSLTEDDIDVSDDGSDLSTFLDCSGSEQVSVTITGQIIEATVCSGDGGAIAGGSVVDVEIGTNASVFGLGTNRIVNPSTVGTFFINLSSSAFSGSIILLTELTSGASVSATVPTPDAPSNNGGGSNGGPATPPEPPIDPPIDEPDIPVEPPIEPPIEPIEPSEPELPDDPINPETPVNDGDGDPVPDPETADEPFGSDGSASEDDVFEPSEPEPDQGLPDVVEGEGLENPNEDIDGALPPAVDVPIETELDEEAGAPTYEALVAPVFSTILQSITETVAVVSDFLKETRSYPEVQAAVDVAIPVAVVGVAATAAVLTSSFSLLSYLQFIFTSPILFIARRKRKAFGVVYNAITKMPIDLATVRLYELTTNRLVTSMVTDIHGRYLFVTNPGEYRIVVAKQGLVFPSIYLEGAKDDGAYLDVYTGQSIQVTQRDATIAANIPMDVQEAAPQATVSLLRRRLLHRVQMIFSFSGVFLSLLVWIFSPSMFSFVLAIVQLVVFLLFLRLARSKKPQGWGVVYDAKTRHPVGNAIVRLFEPKYNKLVESALTDSLGRYSFLVGPNEYFVSTSHEGYEDRIIRPIDYRERQGPEPLIVDVPLDPKS